MEYEINYLQCINLRYKSFYKKAQIATFKDGTKVLHSYSTDVAYIDNKGTLHRLWNGESATSLRHVDEFTLQFMNVRSYASGVDGWRKMSVETLSNEYKCEFTENYKTTL